MTGRGRGRLRDLVLLLPVGALIVFLPPYIRLFDQPVRVFGVPLLPLAIFALWFAGIAMTAAVSRAVLRGGLDPPAPEETPEIRGSPPPGEHDGG
ncbi:MAG: hypothetical protein RID91_03450 [Azospirillaceae bacterium]